MSRVVHVLLGDSAAGSFKQSGIADPNDVVALRDALSLGPLLPIGDVSSWMDGRRAYWRDLLSADDLGDEEDLYSDPIALLSNDEIVLWLGTELADQIAQAWLPVYLRALDAQSPELKIIQFERNSRGREVPGLGMLHPKEIAAHPPPMTLTKEQLVELDIVWQALTSTEPAALSAYLRTASRFPRLVRALGEGLTRFPDATTGVNAWEYRLLRNVTRARECPRVIGQTLADSYDAFFAGTGGRDQVGDGWLFARMRRLADGSLREPALEITGSGTEYVDREVRLTPFGQRVLDKKANFVDANGIDDWVFGVHLQSAAGRVWFHRDGDVVRR